MSSLLQQRHYCAGLLHGNKYMSYSVTVLHLEESWPIRTLIKNNIVGNETIDV